MKNTLLVGISGLAETERNVVNSLSRNLGIHINTKYGDIRVVTINMGGSGVHQCYADVLLARDYEPTLQRSKQQIYSYMDKMNQRHVLSRVGKNNPTYYSQAAYPNFSQLPSGKKFLAKPALGARSLCQLTFDTVDKTGGTIHEIIANTNHESTHWEINQKKLASKVTSIAHAETIPFRSDEVAEPALTAAYEDMGSNIRLPSRNDRAYFGYLATHGIHYHIGHQHKEGEALGHFNTRDLFIEELVEDVVKEFRLICVGGRLVIAYGRTLVPTPGSVPRPMGSQELLTAPRFTVEALGEQFPGLEPWLEAMYEEHKFPTWSVDLYRRATGQWGAFEFSCEYSLADLTTDDQQEIYSMLVERWVEMDSDFTFPGDSQ